MVPSTILPVDKPGAELSVEFAAERLNENILALSDTAVILTAGNGITYCSQSIRAVLGVARDTVVAQGWPFLRQMVLACDLELLEKKVFPLLRSFFRNDSDDGKKKLTFSFTIRMRTPDQSAVLVAVEIRPFHWLRKDWPSTYMTVLRDISPFGNKAEMKVNVYRHLQDSTYHAVLQRTFSFRSDVFTEREIEIIRCVARGMTSAEIASQLFISPETVRSHRKKILHKAGCSTSVALTNFAFNNGIL